MTGPDSPATRQAKDQPPKSDQELEGSARKRPKSVPFSAKAAVAHLRDLSSKLPSDGQKPLQRGLVVQQLLA